MYIYQTKKSHYNIISTMKIGDLLVNIYHYFYYHDCFFPYNGLHDLSLVTGYFISSETSLSNNL